MEGLVRIGILPVMDEGLHGGCSHLQSPAIEIM
jgi:hypothetical protein